MDEIARKSSQSSPLKKRARRDAWQLLTPRPWPWRVLMAAAFGLMVSSYFVPEITESAFAFAIALIALGEVHLARVAVQQSATIDETLTPLCFQAQAEERALHWAQVACRAGELGQDVAAAMAWRSCEAAWKSQDEGAGA